MSDEEYISEESGKDFSASEDEWKPSKKDMYSSESESSDNEQFDLIKRGSKLQNEKEKNTRYKRSGNSSNEAFKVSNALKKRINQSLRDKLYNKYKPPPKTISSPVKINNKLAAVLNNSQFRKKSINKVSNDEESDSSIDDHLVDINNVDLSASCYKMSENKCKEKSENFDCDVGCLTDSEEDDCSNTKEQNVHNFDNFFNYNEKLEKTKQTLRKFKYTEAEDTENENNVDNISKLLAVGESSTKSPKINIKKSKKRGSQDSDSDWEEVDEINPTKARNEGNLDIYVQLPGNVRDKKNKYDEFEILLRRQLNKIIKENQLNLHKVNILCWIAHMNYVNPILNDFKLYSEVLKLIPSQYCYPKEKTNKNYIQQICKWYNTLIAIKDQTIYPQLKKRPSLDVSLSLQIKNKSAICKRDFIFIFVLLSRAIGIQCRIVYNLVTVPIRPSNSKLWPINRKDSKIISSNKNESPAKDQQIKKVKDKKPKTQENAAQENLSLKTEEFKRSPCKRITRSKSKNYETNKTENVAKIPQLDGGDNDIENENTKISTNRLLRSRGQILNINSKTKYIKDADKKELLKQSQEELTLPKKKSTTEKLSKHASTSKEIQVIPSKRIKLPSKNVIKLENVPSSSKLEPISEISSLKNTNKIGKSNTNHTIEVNIDKKPLKKIKKENTNTISTRKRNVKKNESDEDFSPSPVKKIKIVSSISSPLPSTSKTTENANLHNSTTFIDRRVLSSDDEFVENKTIPKKKKLNKKSDEKKNIPNNKYDYWIEIYSEEDKKWISVDLFKVKIDCIEDIYRQATHPIAYIFAWNNDNSLKDVTARYCTQWNTVARKLRVDQTWLNKAIKQFIGPKTERDKKEDRELNKIHINKPIPTTITEYKNHPLYALRRHLLKFEEIYPPDALILGYVREEPVYSRDCVHTLHSREIWVKQAKVVKLGEKPYKIVTGRPKWDKLSQSVIKGQPLEIFGVWQTQDYEPPTAENGIVPRNSYGNVELFKSCMLPKKTVHLQLNGLNRVCKKLQIDCAPAVVGFDFHSGSCHPTFDGFVVCEEFAELVTDAWIKDQEDLKQKEVEKYEQRVHSNWKKLIKGLLLKEKLKIKYNYENLNPQ